MKGRVCLMGLLVTLVAGFQVYAYRGGVDVPVTTKIKNNSEQSIVAQKSSKSSVVMAMVGNEPIYTSESTKVATSKGATSQTSTKINVRRIFAVAPEPSGLIPMICGAVGLMGIVRRKRL